MSTKQTRRKDQGLPDNGGRFAATEHVEADASVVLGIPADPGQQSVTDENVWNLLAKYGLDGDGAEYDGNFLRVSNPNTDNGFSVSVDNWEDIGQAREGIAKQLAAFNADYDFDINEIHEGVSPIRFARGLEEDEKYYHQVAREMRGLPPEPKEAESDKVLDAFRNLSEDEQKTVETAVARRRALKSAVDANRWSEDLPKWPEDLSEPTVYTELSDADLADIEVYVSWEKDGVSDGMTFYKTPYDTYSNLGSEDHPDSPGTVQLDPETRAQVEEYAEAAWKRADDLYGELAATSLNDNRDIISHFAQNKI